MVALFLVSNQIVCPFFLKQNISEEWQLGELNPEMLENTAYSFEMQAPQNGNGPIAMQVDGLPEPKKHCSKLNSNDIVKQPLIVEFIRFLNLLRELTLDAELSPRSLASVALLEQIVQCLRDDSHQFLQFVPFHLLDGIIRSTYDVLTFEQLLAYLSLDSVRARKTGAKLLCQLQQTVEQHSI